MPEFRGTTILSVRRGNTVVIGGDGQVSLGNTVMKGNACKVRLPCLNCLTPSSLSTKAF